MLDSEAPAAEVDSTSDPAIDVLWRTLDHVSASIQFADTKAGTILLTDAALATVVAARLVDAHTLLHRNYFFIAVLVIGALLWLGSAYYAIRCVRPRLGKGDPNSLIYFGHIARRYEGPRQYLQAVRSGLATEQQMIDEISQQIWANSRVCMKKHSDARIALDFLVATVILAIIAGGKIVIASLM